MIERMVVLGAVAAQNYLRLSKIEYECVECPWYSASPSGQLPCLDWKGTLICTELQDAGPLSDIEEASFIIDSLQAKGHSLDSGLSEEEKSKVLAYTALIKSFLIPAVQGSLWRDEKTYNEVTKRCFGSGLGFPLNKVLPYVERCKFRRKFAVIESLDDAYGKACMTLAALAHVQNSNGGKFLVSTSPSSLDALVCACLSYIRCLPVHQEVRKAMKQHKSLEMFPEYLGVEIMSTDVADSMWDKNRSSHREAQKTTKTDDSSPHAVQMQKTGQYWLIGVGVLVFAFIALGGNYLEVQIIDEDHNEDEHEASMI